MNNVSQFCPGLFIFTYFIHACSYPFDSCYLQPTTLEAAVKIHATRAFFFRNIDPLNTSFNLSPSFESTERKIDAAAEVFSTTPLAGDKFSDAEDYAKNENEDDDLDLGNNVSDVEDYANNKNDADAEDCIKEWQLNKEYLAKLTRKHDKAEWELNGCNELVGKTVMNAAKYIAFQTYNKEGKKRKGDVVSGCIQRYITNEFSSGFLPEISNYKELDKDLPFVSEETLSRMPDKHFCRL